MLNVQMAHTQTLIKHVSENENSIELPLFPYVTLYLFACLRVGEIICPLLSDRHQYSIIDMINDDQLQLAYH